MIGLFRFGSTAAELLCQPRREVGSMNEEIVGRVREEESVGKLS